MSNEILPGIILRRNTKSHFNEPENMPVVGELVYDIESGEIGTSINGEVIWSPIVGVVSSVAGKTGVVILNKRDVGLENVDNTADIDKPLSNLVKLEFQKHYEANNPHNITKKTIGLENVDNIADIDKPVSNLTQIELNKKISWEDAREQAGGKDPVFTDTTYTIKDGELSEYNFSFKYKNIIDTLFINKQLLNSGQALFVDGRNITLVRANGETETIQTQDTIYDDTELRKLISDIDNKIIIIDDLESDRTDASLSARQGSILKTYIDEIKSVLDLSGEQFTNIKEIIDYIEENRDKFDDLSITNIRGLQDALNNKVNIGSDINTSPNTDKFANKSVDEFVLSVDYTPQIQNILDTLNVINSEMENFETITGAEQKIAQAILDLNYSETISNINNSLIDLQNQIDAIDIESISNELLNTKTELNNKIINLETTVNDRLDNFATIVDSFDPDAIDLKIEQFKNEVNSQVSGLQDLVGTLNQTINDSVNEINVKINNLASNERVNALEAEFNEKIDNLKLSTGAQNHYLVDDLKELKDSITLNPSLRDQMINEINGNYYTFGTLEYKKAAIGDLNTIVTQQNNIPSLLPQLISALNQEIDKIELIMSFDDIRNMSFLFVDEKIKTFCWRPICQTQRDGVIIIRFIEATPSNCADNFDKIKLVYDQTNTITRKNLTDPGIYEIIVGGTLPEISDNLYYIDAECTVNGNTISMVFSDGNLPSKIVTNANSLSLKLYKQQQIIADIQTNDFIQETSSINQHNTYGTGFFSGSDDKIEFINEIKTNLFKYLSDIEQNEIKIEFIQNI